MVRFVIIWQSWTDEECRLQKREDTKHLLNECEYLQTEFEIGNIAVLEQRCRAIAR